MKRSLIFAAAVAALSLSTLSAQSFETVRVHFDQPIQAAGVALPAGDYSITMVKNNGDIPLLRFTSDTGANAVVFASREQRQGGEASSRTEVVLDRSGSTERLLRIEVEGSSVDFVVASGR